MDTGTNSLETLKRKRKELDNLLGRKEAECHDLRHQRNALECAIAVLANDDTITPTHNEQA